MAAAGGGLLLLLLCACIAFLLLFDLFDQYDTDDTPQGVSRNYQTALVNRDYERAYGYLSPTLAGYPPTVEVFKQQLLRHSVIPPQDISVCMSVESFNLATDTADVTFKEQWYSSCLDPSSNLSWHFIEMRLRSEDSEWKLVDSEQHFAACWRQAEGCQ